MVMCLVAQQGFGMVNSVKLGSHAKGITNSRGQLLEMTVEGRLGLLHLHLT